MSIFVSIPSLNDPELEYTIQDIIDNSDNFDQIHVGVACMTDIDFFNNIKNKFIQYNNIEIKYFDPLQNLGVGKGRNNAYSMYNNEDYLLQIDAHTKFEKGWDTFLIDLYQEALIETKNDKTVLTAYLGRYRHLSGIGRVKLDSMSCYPFYSTEKMTPALLIPRWNTVPFRDIPLALKNTTDIFYKKFVPCTKFNANFAFGGKEFAKNTGLYIDAVFFDEEIIQSINLIYDGFDLVFPNVSLPLMHLYSQDIRNHDLGKRQLVGHEHNKDDINVKNTNASYLNFINDPNNLDKCKKYKEYADIDYMNGNSNLYYIPKNFIKSF